MSAITPTPYSDQRWKSKEGESGGQELPHGCMSAITPTIYSDQRWKSKESESGVRELPSRIHVSHKRESLEKVREAAVAATLSLI